MKRTSRGPLVSGVRPQEGGFRLLLKLTLTYEGLASFVGKYIFTPTALLEPQVALVKDQQEEEVATGRGHAAR